MNKHFTEEDVLVLSTKNYSFYVHDEYKMIPACGKVLSTIFTAYYIDTDVPVDIEDAEKP